MCRVSADDHAHVVPTYCLMDVDGYLSAMPFTCASSWKPRHECSSHEHEHKKPALRQLEHIVHSLLLVFVLRCHAFCREDAHAAMQLYQIYVKDDPALMTYQELVNYELRKMNCRKQA